MFSRILFSLTLILSISLQAMEHSSSSSSSTNPESNEEFFDASDTDSSFSQQSTNNTTHMHTSTGTSWMSAINSSVYSTYEKIASLLWKKQPTPNPAFEQMIQDEANRIRLENLKNENPGKYAKEVLPAEIASYITCPEDENKNLMAASLAAAPNDLLRTIGTIKKRQKSINPVIQEDCEQGFIFYGPGGTGKTTLAKAISVRLGRPYILLRDENLSTGYQNSSSENFSKIVKQVLALRIPITIIIDEIDILIRNNGKHDFQGTRAAHSIAGLFDDLLKEKNESVLVVATTNHPAALSEPLRQRFGGNAFKLDFLDRNNQITQFISLLKPNDSIRLAESCDENYFATNIYPTIKEFSTRLLFELAKKIRERALDSTPRTSPVLTITRFDIGINLIRFKNLKKEFLDKKEKRSFDEKMQKKILKVNKRGLEIQKESFEHNKQAHEDNQNNHRRTYMTSSLASIGSMIPVVGPSLGALAGVAMSQPVVEDPDRPATGAKAAYNSAKKMLQKQF